MKKQTFIKSFRMCGGAPISRQQIAAALRDIADDLERPFYPNPDQNMYHLNDPFAVFEISGRAQFDHGCIGLIHQQ